MSHTPGRRTIIFLVFVMYPLASVRSNNAQVAVLGSERSFMDFTLPANIVCPKVLNLLSLHSRTKKARLAGSVCKSYPFDAMLSDHTASSRIGGWVKELPIDSSKTKILEAIRAADVVYITAETASGKTTRVPQFFFRRSAAAT